ncbi:MAG: calcium-binding protein [Pseudomonadota bacterium]
MTTFTLQGFLVDRDQNDNVTEVDLVSASAVFPTDPPNLRYTVDIPAGGDELLDTVDLVFPPLTFLVDGVLGNDNWEALIGQITTPAGTHQILVLFNPVTDTDYIFQLGGDPLTFPTTIAEFNALEASITSGGSITSGPLAPNTDINVGTLPNVTSTDDDFLIAPDTGVNFDGGVGDDTLQGGAGDDTLLGGDGSDILNGGGGNDSLNTGDNSDFDAVEASTGNDTINLGDANPTDAFVILNYGTIGNAISATINGVTGVSTVNKFASGTDTILGVAAPLNAGAVIGGLAFDGTAQADTLNFTLAAGQWLSVRGGLGNDTITINGDGFVRLNYNDGGAIVANFGTNIVTRSGETDTIFGDVSELRGSNDADSMTGSANDESFIGRSGNDTINGGGGFDRVRYDRSGNDSAVTVDLAAGTATGTFNGNAFAHTLSNIEWVRGSGFGDSITGAGAKELLDGKDGDDTLIGGGNEDTLRGGDGADSLDGGDGFDFAAYDDADSRVRIDLLNSNAAIGDAVGDTYANIEAFDLTDFNDVFNGDNGINWAYGLDGDDKMKGRGGRDRLFGEEGNDELNGGKGRDRLEGGDGNDLLQGLGGLDNLRGGKGDDTMEGGDNRDILIGGRGRDIIDGGGDDDNLSGSSDADTFLFADGHGNDIITDFAATNDNEKIDLSAVSAIASIGDITGPGGAGSQVGADVLIDTGGGNSILLQGVQLADLGDADFIF